MATCLLLRPVRGADGSGDPEVSRFHRNTHTIAAHDPLAGPALTRDRFDVNSALINNCDIVRLSAGLPNAAAATQDVGGARGAATLACASLQTSAPALRLHLSGQCLDSSEFEVLANTT